MDNYAQLLPPSGEYFNKIKMTPKRCGAEGYFRLLNCLSLLKISDINSGAKVFWEVQLRYELTLIRGVF